MDAEQPLPPWRPLLTAARKREGRLPGGRWLQLATLSVDGYPRVRTLVFRDWSAAATLDLLTDARSEKCLEIERTPEVELCWLFRKAREQFRLRGTATLICSHRGFCGFGSALEAAPSFWPICLGLASSR